MPSNRSINQVHAAEDAPGHYRKVEQERFARNLAILRAAKAAAAARAARQSHEAEARTERAALPASARETDQASGNQC